MKSLKPKKAVSAVEPVAPNQIDLESAIASVSGGEAAEHSTVMPNKSVEHAVASNQAVSGRLDQKHSQVSKMEIVTSMKLKRLRVANAYYARFFLSDSDYTWLNTLGISMGVTWDEALRGLIAQHQCSGDQTSGLKNFVPALG